MAINKKTYGSRGFTLVEVLVAVVILAIGILAVSQMTVMGMRTTVVIRDYQQAREAVAMGLEALISLVRPLGPYPLPSTGTSVWTIHLRMYGRSVCS
jgi:prepilin-type N-terminal cleavage/methylation domain-containing protein